MGDRTFPITIDYFFTVVSPWTYLGDARFHELAGRFGARIAYHPLSSRELLPATGGLPLKDRAPARKAYRMIELARWRDHLRVPLNLEPKHFPVPEAPASKLILAAQDAGLNAAPLVGAIFKAVWVDELNIADADTLRALTDAVGLDGAALMQSAQDPRFEQAFAEDTQAAIARGVFGYPTYVFDGEPFWGQDRLAFLQGALERATLRP